MLSLETLWEVHFTWGEPARRVFSHLHGLLRLIWARLNSFGPLQRQQTHTPRPVWWDCLISHLNSTQVEFNNRGPWDNVRTFQHSNSPGNSFSLSLNGTIRETQSCGHSCCSSELIHSSVSLLTLNPTAQVCLFLSSSSCPPFSLSLALLLLSLFVLFRSPSAVSSTSTTSSSQTHLLIRRTEVVLYSQQKDLTSPIWLAFMLYNWKWGRFYTP